MGSKIDEILSSRKPAPVAPQEDGSQSDKFFSVLIGEGMEENFFEVRFRDGTKTCFPYHSLSWFNISPEEGIDLDFDGYMICIKGRGLDPKLWNGIKQKRVAWVKEADVELQDHQGNEAYISEITITPPEGFTGEEAAE
jgi:hypothetical protein